MAKRCIELHSTNLAQLPRHDFDRTPFFMVEGEFVEYGFLVTAPPDLDLKPGFPNCCEYHAGLLAYVTDWFSKFPDCCVWHREMAQKPWFNLSKYHGRPWKILLQVCYTTHHIHQKIDTSDWYDDIIEYIAYNVASFGSPAVGGTQYLAYVEGYVRGGTEDFWTAEKRQRLLDYLDQQQHPDMGQVTDLNLLASTFQKWLNAVPTLPAFTDLKAALTGKVPVDLMLHTPQHNRYLGQTAYKTRTRGEFVGLLLDLTKSLLAGVQSADLVREEVITDVHAHRVRLLGEQHRLRQSRLVATYSKGEGKYLKLLKNWLGNEEKYFADLLPLLPTPALPPVPTKPLATPTVPTTPTIQKLQNALACAAEFKENNGISAAFTAWKDATYRTLVQMYGKSSLEATRFNELRFALRPGAKVVRGTPDHQERKRKAFHRDLHIAVAALTSYLADLTDDMNTSAHSVDAANPAASTKRVFISHSSQDAAIVTELLDILGVLGLGPDHIFCSSVDGYGIPLGENFYERLKTELTADVLVLFVLSPNFFQSPICLCEMGAAWVLTKDHVPVLIPPFDFANMRGVIPATQGLKLTDKLKVNELANKVARHFGIVGPAHCPNWERKRDKGLNQVEHLIAQQETERK